MRAEPSAQRRPQGWIDEARLVAIAPEEWLTGGVSGLANISLAVHAALRHLAVHAALPGA